MQQRSVQYSVFWEGGQAYGLALKGAYSSFMSRAKVFLEYQFSVLFSKVSLKI